MTIGSLGPDMDRNRLSEFLRRLGWPCFVGATSSFKGSVGELADPEIPAMKTWLDGYDPDMILHIGRPLVSKYWDSFRAASMPEYVVISSKVDSQNPIGSDYLHIHVADFDDLFQEQSMTKSTATMEIESWLPWLMIWLLKGRPSRCQVLLE